MPFFENKVNVLVHIQDELGQEAFKPLPLMAILAPSSHINPALSCTLHYTVPLDCVVTVDSVPRSEVLGALF